MKIIGILVTLFVCLVVSPLWRGFVLAKLWAWFIASTFGLPVVSMVQAMGISLVVGFLTYQRDVYEDKDKPDNRKMAEGVCFAVIYPAFALGAGCIIKAWM